MNNYLNRLIISRFILIVIITAAFLLPDSVKAQTHHDWTYNLAMYEVNIRQFTPEGTFAAFEEHLDRLQELGVGILWLMPVHPIGEENRLGSLGSYYSVKDYKDINPEFGTLEDFENLVQEIHARGMYVMMDWVPNHTSWDNYLTQEYPEWYVTDSGGNFIPPPGTNWSDVIQLDHSKPELREYMVDAMTFWVEEFGVDGFRFDAAGFVPMDFWEDVLPQLRDVRPDIFLLAEDIGHEFHNAGFDMTFGWDYYGFGQGILIRIADGVNNGIHLNSYVNSQISTYPPDGYVLYFTSNHDENSWYGTTQELFGDSAEVFAVLTSIFHSMPLIYSGQEAGLDKRLAFFDKDLIPWQEHPNFELYQTLFNLKRENKALWNGTEGANLQRVSTSNNASVFAFRREKEDDRVFAAVNLRGVPIDVTLSGTAFTGVYRDVFTGDIIEMEEGEILSLPPYGYVVYELTGTDVAVTPDEVPDRFSLGQNYPNPFNPTTTISYTLTESGHVTLEVFTLAGQRVSVLADEARPAGEHTVSWDATGLSSGMYIYQIRASSYSETRKMMLLK